MAGTKKKTLFELFVNQHVQITLKLNISSNDGEFFRSTPFALSGWLIDEVEGSYVFGENLETYSFYIPKSEIALLEIVQSKDKLSLLVSGFEE